MLVSVLEESKIKEVKLEKREDEGEEEEKKEKQENKVSFAFGYTTIYT